MNLLKNSLQDIEQKIAIKQGISTGYPALDEITRGLQLGELTIIAGRSSMGKTAFMLDLALNLTCPSAIFSLEMGENQLIERMIVNKQECSLYDLKNGKVKINDSVLKELEARPIYIDDTSGISTVYIDRALAGMADVRVVFVDYLQLLRSAGIRDFARYEEVDKMCQHLKQIAKTRNIAVVLLCQLNRNVENRDDHKPRLSDLRESGGIEQVTDVILFLYRPSYYRGFEDEDGEAHIFVEKNRNGKRGDVPVVWLAESMSFRPVNFKLEDF